MKKILLISLFIFSIAACQSEKANDSVKVNLKSKAKAIAAMNKAVSKEAVEHAAHDGKQKATDHKLTALSMKEAKKMRQLKKAYKKKMKAERMQAKRNQAKGMKAGKMHAKNDMKEYRKLETPHHPTAYKASEHHNHSAANVPEKKLSLAAATGSSSPFAQSKLVEPKRENAKLVKSKPKQVNSEQVSVEVVKARTQEAIDTTNRFIAQKEALYTKQIEDRYTSFKKELERLNKRADVIKEQSKKKIAGELEALSKKMSSTEAELSNIDVNGDEIVESLSNELQEMLASVQATGTTKVKRPNVIK